jgi:hypothetical protein
MQDSVGEAGLVMADKPKQVQEVVWTGTSDRQISNDADLFVPGKTSKGKLLKTNRDSGDVADNRGKPLYTEGADQPQAKSAKPPAPKPAEPKQKSATPAPAKQPVASAAPPALPPKPAVQKPSAGVTPREKSRVIAKAVVGSFVDRLKTEAKSKGGSLTIDDIESLDQEFEQKTAALETLFEKTFEEYARTYAKGGSEERRSHPFDRLIVGPIEKILAGGTGPSIDKGGISRRILPGFFMGVNMMMGPDIMAEYRIRAKNVFKRLGGSNGGDWQHFFDDSEARDLRLDALIAMAVHFSNPDKRAHWFMGMINDHLAPVDDDAGADAAWRLARPAYERLIDALFADLMTAVSSPQARESITKRFGPETCASVAAIMKGLGA